VPTVNVDIKAQVKGMSDVERLERRMEAVEKNFDKVAVTAPKATNQIKRFGDQAKKAESKVSGLTKSLRGFLTAAAVLGTARFVIGKTSELETQTRSLQVLTGELETAQRIVRELQSFAAVTPFTSSELIESAKRLKAFGVDTENLVATTQRLADVSGATGARLNEVATAYGQIQAKGRLQGEELLQLQERGIALQDELQKMYGLTGEEFSKALQKGQFSAEAAEVAIVRLTEKGGKYADGAISQSDTLAGKFSTLIDGIDNIARALGTVLAPALKSVLDLAIDAVNNINAAFAAGSISPQQKQGFKSQAEAEVKRFAGPLPGGPFGAGEIVVRTNGKTYKGPASSVVSQITNDLINKEVQRLTEKAAPKIPKSNVPVQIPELLGGGSSSGSSSGSSRKGSDAAAKAAEREAERVAKTLRDREQLVKRLEQQIKIQNEITGLGKEEQRLQLEILEINQQYDNLLLEETDELIRQNTERARALELTLALNEAQQSMMSAAQNDFTSFLKQQPEYAGLLNDELTETEELLKGSYEIIAGELTGAIEGLVKGTADWGDVLSSILSQLGSMFLNAGVNGLGTAIGIPGFADGGRPRVNAPSIVGERGPELFVPDTAGTVVNNADTRATLDRYSGNNETSSYSSSLSITTGPVMQMNNDQYIRRADFERGLKQASDDGAKRGEAMALRRLKNSRSTRAQLGM